MTVNFDVSKLAVAITTAAIIATGTALWSLGRDIVALQERINIVQVRITEVLNHSDARDEKFDERLREIERHLH